MIEVIPTVIASSQDDLKNKIAKLEPYIQRISIDIMDGFFVPNTTVGVNEVLNLDSSIAFDLHLMVTAPENQIDQWLSSKADRIIVHAESSENPNSILEKIKSQNKKAALALNPETPISKIENLISKIDFIQFMTVSPGQYGAPFVDEVVSKISQFHGQYPQVVIAVDGGINPETAKAVKEAGATILNVGSYIQNSDNPAEAIKLIQNA